MITNFRSRDLGRYWEKSDGRGLNPQLISKIERVLGALDRATQVEDMNVPGFKLHKLTGHTPDRWSIWITANWRITFSFADGDAFDIDFEDYH